MEFIISEEAQLDEVCLKLISHFEPPGLIFLNGELGSGKTTFVKHFAKLAKIQDKVTSPTFTKIHEYIGEELVIYHLDLYRSLPGFDEFAEIMSDSQGIIFVEWASRFAEQKEFIDLIKNKKNLNLWEMSFQVLFESDERKINCRKLN